MDKNKLCHNVSQFFSNLVKFGFVALVVFAAFSIIKVGFDVMNMPEPFEGTEYEQDSNQLTGVSNKVEDGTNWLIDKGENLGGWINEKTK